MPAVRIRHQLDADTGKDVGFTSLHYVPERDEFVAVSGLQGSIWHIDGQLRQARRMLRQAPRMTGCGARASALRGSVRRVSTDARPLLRHPARLPSTDAVFSLFQVDVNVNVT